MEVHGRHNHRDKNGGFESRREQSQSDQAATPTRDPSVSILTHRLWHRQQKEKTRKCSFNPWVYVCAVLMFFIWKKHRQGASEIRVACGLESLPEFRGNRWPGHVNVRDTHNLKPVFFLSFFSTGGIKEVEGTEMGKTLFSKDVNTTLQEFRGLRWKKKDKKEKEK